MGTSLHLALANWSVGSLPARPRDSAPADGRTSRHGGAYLRLRFHPDGPPEPLNSGGAEPGRCVDGSAWLHFSLADVRAQKWISACERIPPRGREVLLDTDSHIHMEPAGCGFVGVLGDLHYEFDADPDRVGVMRLYVDEDLVECRFTAQGGGQVARGGSQRAADRDDDGSRDSARRGCDRYANGGRCRGRGNR